MSHFAEIDDNNVVVRVLVGDNDMPNEGYDWFVENLGGRWVQTSYNSNFRKRFARPGYIYVEELDAFVSPKPFSSWMLNDKLAVWQPPIPRPEEGNWYWNEELVDWSESVEI